jgi:hypothetical protein
MSSLKTPPRVKKKAKITDTRSEEDELPLTQQQERNKVDLKKHSIDLEPDVAYSKMMVDWRHKCYAHGDMLDYLKNDDCIGEMVSEYNKCIENYSSTSCGKKKDMKPGSKTFAGATTEGTTGSNRTKVEEKMTKSRRDKFGAVETQGVYSIGNWQPLSPLEQGGWKKDTPIPKIHDDDGFNIWEKKYCWLCGLPLAFGDAKAVMESQDTEHPIYPDQPISCEHKLPLMEMILYGAGVQTAIDQEKLLRTDSTTTTPVGKRAGVAKPEPLREALIHPQWKEFVRTEGYGWSHHWCNMKKNALPFMTVRSWSRQVPGQDEDQIRFQFNMEINNIYKFLLDLFKVKKIKIALPDQVKFFPGDENYKFDKAEGPRNWDPIRLWGEMMDMNDAEFTSFKQQQVEKAFSNIVKMLVPTYFLLNSGREIPRDLIVKRNALFGRGKGGESERRTMFEYIDELSLIDRFKDNFGRLKSVRIITGKFSDFLKRPNLPKVIQSLFACRGNSAGSSNDDTTNEFLKDLDKVFKLQGKDEKDLGKRIQRENSILLSPQRLGGRPKRERRNFVTNLGTIKDKDDAGLKTIEDDESNEDYDFIDLTTSQVDESNDDEGAKKPTHSSSDEENLLSPENSGRGANVESFFDESETQLWLENTESQKGGGKKKKKKRKKRTKKRRRRKKKTRRKRKKKRTKKKKRKRKKRTRRRR